MSLNFCLIQKLDARKATLEKTAALTDEKKAKWREVVVFSFMSSEESGEEEVGDVTRPVPYTKALPWRSSHVTRFFNQLDHKVEKNKTKRAKLQTLPRVPGPISTRAKPTDLPPNHWGFTTAN